LIRANFHVDPGTLSLDEWARLFNEAAWLERKRAGWLAGAIAGLLAPLKGDP
jgi:hypothetical protein